MGIKVVRYQYEQKVAWGVVQQEQVFPVGQELATLRDLLEVGLEQVKKSVMNEPIPAAAVQWLSPVTAEAQIICQGLNYLAHRREAGSEVTPRPPFNLIFGKASSAICGPHDDVLRPAGVQLLDYEAELGLVIGRAVTQPVQLSSANLLEVVAGLVIANDISARDVQFTQEQWLKGKSYRTFCPVGPYFYWLEAADVPFLEQLEIKLWVNGQLRQNGHTSQLLFKPAETLSELSQIMDLRPGDLVLTGTPAGVALKAPPPTQQRLANLLWNKREQAQRFVQGQKKRPFYLQNGDLIRTTIHSPQGEIDLGMQVNRIAGAPLLLEPLPRSLYLPQWLMVPFVGLLLWLLWRNRYPPKPTA